MPECTFLLKAAVAAALSIYGLIFEGDLSPQEIANFLPAYNAVEPKSDYKADTILVFLHPTTPQNRTVLIGNGPCLEQVDSMPLAVLQGLRSPGKPM